LNIRELEYLVAVHKYGSFSKAADHCNVSQPTLSGQLKKLEGELSVQLIERSTRHIILYGDDVLAGDFHIGLIPTVGPFLLPLIMPVLSEAFPNVNLYLYELRTKELIKRLMQGELDAGILAKVEWSEPLDEIMLYQENMRLAVPSRGELASNTNKPVDINVLENRDVLMLEDGHCLRDQALGVCFTAGAKEDRRFQATSMDTLLHMVANGSGITLIPELACQNRVDGTEFIEFTAPIPTRDIIMITRKNTARREALEQIAKSINQTYKKSQS